MRLQGHISPLYLPYISPISPLQVQLLVKPAMVGMYTAFDEVLRKLRKLASRRRLFDDELYQATRLMGTLTMHCYEEAAGSAGRSLISPLYLPYISPTSPLYLPYISPR